MAEALKVDENPFWSPTRLGTMEKCRKAYWFEYVKHLKYMVPSAVAIGKHNHRIAEKMWLADSHNSKILVPGYSSYSACVNTSVGNWKHFYASTGKMEGRVIDWGDYDCRGYSPRLFGRIAETAGLIYTRGMNEEPRLASEIEIKVEFEGLKIMARIDELRKGLIIRDHKSGGERIGEYFVKNNLQLTLCAMCLFQALQEPYTLVSDIYPEHAEINLDRFLDVLNVEINDIFPRTEKGVRKSNSVIYPAKRTEKDFHDVIAMIQSARESLRKRDFHPSRENCDYCFYKKDCNSYNPEDYHAGEYTKLFPLFASAGMVLEDYKPRTVRRSRQKSFRFN